jgi:DNA-binding MarR family transcriptional regulator
LSKLESEGLVTKISDGRKTVYEITDAGRAELAARESELGAIEDEVTDSVRRLADEVRAGVNEAMRSLRADLASAAREAKRGRSADPEHTTDVHPTPRQDSNAAVRDAEVVLNDFRQQMRTDLRSRAARGGLQDAVVAQLRHELAQVRANVLGTLK